MEKSKLLSSSKMHKTPYLQISVADIFDIFSDNNVKKYYATEYLDEMLNIIFDAINEKLETDNTSILLILEE